MPTKRKNPADLTLRNLRAQKKRIESLERRVMALEFAVRTLVDALAWDAMGDTPRKKATKR